MQPFTIECTSILLREFLTEDLDAEAIRWLMIEVEADETRRWYTGEERPYIAHKPETQVNLA